MAAAAASVLLVGVFDISVRLTSDAEQEISSTPPTSQATTTTSTSTTSTTTTSTTTTTAPPAPASTLPPDTTTPTTAPPAPAPTAPSSGWPTDATTGVTNSAALTEWTGGCVLTTPNQVIENKIFDCGVEVRASGVTIRNALVRSDQEWGIEVSVGGAPATIEDVTVQSASGCNAAGEALAAGNYHATRVKVLNFGVAFLAWDNNTVVRDSYAKLCSQGANGPASIGISGFDGPNATSERPYIFDHNTIDQRCGDWGSVLPDNMHPGSGNAGDQACNAVGVLGWEESGSGLQVTGNLFRGGEFAFGIESGSGHIVTGNVIERGSYAYSPIYQCRGVTTWNNNWLADISDGVATNQTPLSCDG